MLIRIRKLSSSCAGHACSDVASRAATTRLTCFDRLFCSLFTYILPVILRCRWQKKSIKKWRSKELPINNNKNLDSNLLRELDIKIIVYILRDMAALDKQTQSHVAVIACPTCWTSETATTMNKSKTKKKWDAKKKRQELIHFGLYKHTQRYLYSMNI